MSKWKWLILLLVLAGAAALVWFLLQPDPKVVFKEAQKTLVNAKGLHEAVTFDISGDVTGTVLKDTTQSKTGVGEIKGMTVTDADFRSFPSSSTSTFQIAVDLSDSKAAQLVGASAKKDGIHYLKVIDGSALEGTDAAKLVGHWLKTTTPILRMLFPATELETALPPLTAAESAKLRAALAQADVFTVIGKPTSEKAADGSDVWRYRVQLNLDNAAALLLAMRGLQSGSPVTQQDQDEVSLEVQAWGQPQGDVVIGKKDRRVHSIALSTTLSGGSAATVKVQADFSAYDEHVTFALPPDAVDLEKAAAAVSQANLQAPGPRGTNAAGSSVPSSAPTASATGTVAAAPGDDDGDGLSNSLEFFYGTDAWNPDSDADGYSDGVEVSHGMNPLGPGTLFSFGLGQ